MNCGDFVLLQNEAVSAEPLVPLQSCQFVQLVRRKWICKHNLQIFQPPARFSKKIMNQKILRMLVLTLQSCWPWLSSSKGCLVKHLLHANSALASFTELILSSTVALFRSPSICSFFSAGFSLQNFRCGRFFGLFKATNQLCKVPSRRPGNEREWSDQSGLAFAGARPIRRLGWGSNQDGGCAAQARPSTVM